MAMKLRLQAYLFLVCNFLKGIVVRYSIFWKSIFRVVFWIFVALDIFPGMEFGGAL
jgi:hypothetical protein